MCSWGTAPRRDAWRKLSRSRDRLDAIAETFSNGDQPLLPVVDLLGQIALSPFDTRLGQLRLEIVARREARAVDPLHRGEVVPEPEDAEVGRVEGRDGDSSARGEHAPDLRQRAPAREVALAHERLVDLPPVLVDRAKLVVGRGATPEIRGGDPLVSTGHF